MVMTMPTINGNIAQIGEMHGSISAGQNIIGVINKTILSSETLIFSGTTAYWNSQTDLIGKSGAIYIYEDYAKNGDINIPNIKIGDGKAYLIDNPFITASVEDLLAAHIDDTVKHITEQERESWNNKVRCYINTEDDETIVFTTN